VVRKWGNKMGECQLWTVGERAKTDNCIYEGELTEQRVAGGEDRECHTTGENAKEIKRKKIMSKPAVI